VNIRELAKMIGEEDKRARINQRKIILICSLILNLIVKTVEKLVFIKSNRAAFAGCINEESDADSSVYYSSAEEEDQANELEVGQA
jgi:predicted nucleic acid-binding protein